MAVAREHDVSGLQVPVHDPVLVGVAEPLRDSGSKLERFGHRERFALHSFGEASPAEKLHRDKEDSVVGFVDLMDDADVRMLEGGGGGGFLHESLTALGLLDQILRQDFQRHLAVELLVAGAIDDRKLAPAELFEHGVVRKGFPDHCIDTIPPDWDYGAGSRMFRAGWAGESSSRDLVNILFEKSGAGGGTRTLTAARTAGF